MGAMQGLQRAGREYGKERRGGEVAAAAPPSQPEVPWRGGDGGGAEGRASSPWQHASVWL